MGARGSVVATGQPCACGGACVRACPTGCLTAGEAGLVLDRSACITCGLCIEACASGALAWSPDDELAATGPDGLVVELAHRARLELGTAPGDPPDSEPAQAR